ncbi:hypothetical protein DPMN_097438 [Dreissena polymorpha]|uniref:Uncharacterized protein n=1 Tax=Dreissena polymorpha TaxID=45954 RepID=A0A9D4R4K4_DREPO|nr:hypothetical protein DPMN_097438 [Dreissena polymorpha]
MTSVDGRLVLSVHGRLIQFVHGRLVLCCRSSDKKVNEMSVEGRLVSVEVPKLRHPKFQCVRIQS